MASFKDFDWKALSSITAVFTSLCALYVSYSLMRIASEEQQVNAFPYLSYSYNNSPSQITMNLKNDGLGPAFISGVEVTVHDSVYTDVWIPVKAFLDTFQAVRPISFTKSDLNPGWVVKTGGEPWMVFQLDNFGGDDANKFWAYFTQGDMRLKIWYYDLYDNCWLFDSEKMVEPCETCPKKILKRR